MAPRFLASKMRNMGMPFIEIENPKRRRLFLVLGFWLWSRGEERAEIMDLVVDIMSLRCPWDTEGEM